MIVVILDWDDTLFCTSACSKISMIYKHPRMWTLTLARAVRQMDSQVVTS